MVAKTWDGLEAPAVHAAWAAAPWPIWCAIVGACSLFGLAGPLAISIVLALMVLWAHRPPLAAAARWAPSVIGTGLMGELVVNAISRMGTLHAHQLATTAVVWLVCVALYEVAPIVAAGSRVMPREHRARSLDVAAHVSFVAIAALSWYCVPSYCAMDHVVHGTSMISPMIAAVIALPLAAARSGPRRASDLPATSTRVGAVWAMAWTAWLAAAVIGIADHEELGAFVRRGWGVDAVPYAFPLWSIVLSIVAAVALVRRGWRARNAEAGIVVSVADDAITIERNGLDAPLWIALEGGPTPVEGSTVTLIGLRERTVDVGPFRDGAPKLTARRAFLGTPRDLSRALFQRAGAWIGWAAVGTIGLWILVILR